MSSKSFYNRKRFVAAAAFVALSAGSAMAQKPPASGGTSGAGSSGGVGTGGSVGNNNTITLPNSNNRSTLPNQNTTLDNPQMAPAIFLSGTVQMDDGSKPSSDIIIERVCSGNPRPEAHVDSKGHFSFQVGQSQLSFTDASIGSPADWGGASSRNSSGPSRFGGLGGSAGLSGCELRASYPGYRSDSINLIGRRSLDNPNVGVIILHRLQAVQGTTISVTSALAPKHAQKELEKGLQMEQKGRIEDAEKHLSAAVEEYPQYALAWFQLGKVQQGRGDLDAAKKSFSSAIEADHKYISPYDRLAAMALQDGKWQEAAQFSKQIITLNPVEFPGAFFYSALAEYNLKNLDEAEKNVRQALKLDERHRYPQAESLLAQVMLDKGNYGEAAEHLRAYLALSPNANNADLLKQELLKIEQASAAVHK